MLWMDTSASPVVLKYFDGTDDITVGTFNETTNVFTPSVPTASVTTAMLQDASVTAAKLASGAVVVPQIAAISASVASNALTINLEPATIDFRSATLTSGAVNSRVLASNASVVIPSGATLGTVSGQASRLVAIAIDNAGTVEAAVVNIAGGVNLNEEGVISTTAISGAANAANVVYSTTARTNVPYKVRGFIDSTQATAGAWAAAPSLIVGAGGNVADAMSSFGYGQTNQAVTRAVNTTYYNTTGRPIECFVSIVGPSTDTTATVSLNGGTPSGFAAGNVNSGTAVAGGTFTVPVGQSYNVSGGTLLSWRETR
jgi:hypothetical protein